MAIVLVALGGAAGAVSRYVVDGFVAARVVGPFPWGTLVVNATGSLALGLLFALAVERGILPAQVRGPLMIGFLGAYTTFSTLVLEAWRLWEDGAVWLALADLGLSLVVGVVAVLAGLTIGRALA
jgi:CrcB protein